MFLFRRHAVCDSCWNAEEQEIKFQAQHGAFLITGGVVSRVSLSLFSETKQQVWLRLDVGTRCFTWKSLELVRQEPKDSGTFSVDEISGVQIGDAAVSAANLKRQTATQQGTLQGAEIDHTIRFVNNRGHTLFMFTTGSEGRLFSQWKEAVRQLLSIARLPYTRFMPTRTAAAAQNKSDAAAGQSRAASAAAREERASARGAFRESLGAIGMTHTASIMATREQAPLVPTDGERAAGNTTRRQGPPPTGVEAVFSDLGARLSIFGQMASEQASAVALAAPAPVQDVGRTIGAGFRSFGASASQLLRPPAG